MFKKDDRVRVVETHSLYNGIEGIVRGAHSPDFTYYSVRVDFDVKDVPGEHIPELTVIGADFHPSMLTHVK